MLSSPPRNVRLCPASSAGVLLLVLAVFVALVATKTSSEPVQGEEESAAINTVEKGSGSSRGVNLGSKCHFLPKWLIPVVGISNRSSRDTYDVDASLVGLGIRLDTEYMLAHVQTIMRANDLANAVSNTFFSGPGPMLIFRPGLELGNLTQVVEGFQFYAKYVETLGDEIAVYRIEKYSTRPLYASIYEWSPLDDKDRVKLAAQGASIKKDDCYVLGWGGSQNENLVRSLNRFKVILKHCVGHKCRFGYDFNNEGYISGYYSSLGSPVICSDGKYEVVAYMISNYDDGGPPDHYASFFNAVQLDKFLPTITDKTRYTRPVKTPCPICSI